jgi:DNA-binding IclR family transcriptional regulator
MKGRPRILSVHKTFRVLELVGESKSGYTLTELARNLDISMGAAQRITHTLLELGYLGKEPKTKVFRLTPKFLFLGSAFLQQSEIREVALPYMRKLNEDLDEIVNLGIMINDEEIIYIDRIDKTSHILTTNLRVGTRRPLHLNSIGKVILAFLAESDQKRILQHVPFDKYPSKRLHNRRQLEKQLNTIRELGYSANQSELFEDVYALAVPILNHQGLAVAGINIAIPMSRVSHQQVKKRYIPLLIEAGKKVSRALGNSGEMNS